LNVFAPPVPAKGPFGGYSKLLKNDENDFNDAQLAAMGGRCGFLITEDGGLRERINFLQRRGFIRLQAMDFGDIEATGMSQVCGRQPLPLARLVPADAEIALELLLEKLGSPSPGAGAGCGRQPLPDGQARLRFGGFL
jgi:hypothetical protein